jgi:hypothetical protein
MEIGMLRATFDDLELRRFTMERGGVMSISSRDFVEG